jgi:hypothetical protein
MSGCSYFPFDPYQYVHFSEAYAYRLASEGISMKRLALIACFMFFCSNVAFGTVPYGAKPFLAKFDFESDKVYLSIDDQVKGGCLPSPQSVKDAYEGELRD